MTDEQQKRTITIAGLILVTGISLVAAYTWPGFRAGLGAALFWIGGICAFFGTMTSLMGSKDMGPASAFGGGLAALLGWALLSLV